MRCLNIVPIHPVVDNKGLCGDPELKKPILPPLPNVRASCGELGFEILLKQAELFLPDLLKMDLLVWCGVGPGRRQLGGSKKGVCFISRILPVSEHISQNGIPGIYSSQESHGICETGISITPTLQAGNRKLREQMSVWTT